MELLNAHIKDYPLNLWAVSMVSPAVGYQLTFGIGESEHWKSPAYRQ